MVDKDHQGMLYRPHLRPPFNNPVARVFGVLSSLLPPSSPAASSGNAGASGGGERRGFLGEKARGRDAEDGERKKDEEEDNERGRDPLAPFAPGTRSGRGEKDAAGFSLPPSPRVARRCTDEPRDTESIFVGWLWR